jgi:polyphosphate kinase 2 (PPK2 family)
MAKDKKKAAKGYSAESLKLKNKEYLEQLRLLHVELVKLQEWVKAKGIKICIVFEGRDGAGNRGCFAWWRCRHRRIGKKARCMSSVTCHICRRRAKW